MRPLIAAPSVATGLRKLMSCPLPFCERAEARGGVLAAVAWELNIVYLPNYILLKAAERPGETVRHMPING